MTEFILRIELKSDALIGKGEGWGATIDNDIVFDYLGLPYIPAKRIKGSLRESALEVAEIFELSGINNKTSGYIKELFGRVGNMRSGPLEFSNCYLENYSINRQWLEWLIYSEGNLFSKELILKTFTSIKQHTAIEKNGEKKGVAKEPSLRTSRVLKKDNVFFGKLIFLHEIDHEIVQFLVYSVMNLRYIGTNRNRGLGFVECRLLDSDGKDAGKEYLKKLGQAIKE